MAQLTLEKFMGVINIDSPARKGLIIDNDTGTTKLGIGLRKAENVDITNDYGIRVRKGTTSLLAASGIHSFSDDAPGYFVKGTDFCRLIHINSDNTIEYELLSTVTSGARYRMRYASVGNRVYFCNGIDTGVVVNGGSVEPWGVNSPDHPSTEVLGAGKLRLGKYRFAFTYIKENGQESGSSFVSSIEVTGNGSSIRIYSIGSHSSASVKKINIYMTEPNGSEFFFKSVIDNGTAEITIRDTSNLISPLDTKFLSKAPIGEIVTIYNGRLFMAFENKIYYSEPYRYELFSNEWFPFESNIRMMRAVSNGIFVSTDTEIIFLSGDDIHDFEYIVKASYPAVKHTDVNILGGKSAKEKSIIFTTSRGICIGSFNGEFENITESEYIPDIGKTGAGLFRQENGINQYISTVDDVDSNPEKHTNISITRDIKENYNPSN